MGCAMNKKRIKYNLLLVAAIVTISVSTISCEKVFPNDKLDHFWRLNYVEYPNGSDFSGNICDIDTLGDVYIGFAQDLLQIENHSNGFSAFGVLSDMGDSLRFDFSVYRESDGYDPDNIATNLKMVGIDSLFSTFFIKQLDNKRLILSNESATLRFEKW
jgi:hypothetical protein